MDNMGFVGFHVRIFLFFVHANAKFKLFGHLQFKLLFFLMFFLFRDLSSNNIKNLSEDLFSSFGRLQTL